MRAGVYVRISDDRVGGGLGVARQEKDCRARAESLGWTVAELYRDNDISAASGKRRPGYERMLADIDAGRVEAIVAWHADRLHRRPIELETFIDLVERRNVKISTVTAGELDLATPSGRMVARQLGAVAKYEVEQTTARIKRKARELAEAGKLHGGGSRPFGYEKDRRTVREPEAALIRDAAVRILAGESVRSIATEWGKTGQVVRRIMRSARIAGLREHHGEVTKEAEWPAIIDRGTHERLRQLLDDATRNKRGPIGAGRKYLLSGLAECSLCGTKLIARGSQRRDENGVAHRAPSMVCASGVPFHGCGKIRIRADWLEDAVTEAVLLALDGDALDQHIRAREDAGHEAELQREIDVDEAALDDLALDRYVKRILSEREYLAARAALTAQIERNRAALADMLGTSVLAGLPRGEGALRAVWPSWSVDRRRAVLDAVIARVIVRPGVRGRNTYSAEQLADRIEIVWADEPES